LPAYPDLVAPVHSPEKKKVLEAIATKGPRIVPVEVAAATGLALPLVVSELNNIASETSAHLEVTESGNISYKFPNIQQAYAANASKHFFLTIGRVIANASLIFLRAFCAIMFMVVRISFGIALICAFVAVIALVVIAIVALLKGNSDSDSDSGFNFDFGNIFSTGWNDGYYHRPFYLYWAFDWLWDWFFYWRYIFPPYGRNYGSIYPDTYTNTPARGDAYAKPIDPNKKQGKDFLSSVFSYLFGDGNPNVGFEELKWQTIARIIELNQGVVTAEQLAPYVGQNPANEDWMIQILQRFTGSPEVTESGNIVYIFPAFQSQAGAASIPMGSLEGARTQTRPVDELAGLYQTHIKRQSTSQKNSSQLRFVDKTLLEKEWPFLTVSGGTLTTIILFGITVLGGSLGLIINVNTIPIMHNFIVLLYILFGYGLVFFTVPAIRYYVYKIINDGITKRNDAKVLYAASLSTPSEALAKKLDEAVGVRVSGLPKKPDKLVYDTSIDDRENPDERFDP
jgi:hypothetical protein